METTHHLMDLEDRELTPSSLVMVATLTSMMTRTGLWTRPTPRMDHDSCWWPLMSWVTLLVSVTPR